MSDQSRILLAIGGLVLGLALSAVGTLLLGRARAVAKHAESEHRRRADLGQYAAALGALSGFLLTAGGGGVLMHELLPFSGPVRLFAGAVTGVLVFAAAGIGFSRVADRSEEARVRRMPPPRYAPATPPGRPPGRARAVPGVPAPATAPPTSGPPSRSAPPEPSTSASWTPTDQQEEPAPPIGDAAARPEPAAEEPAADHPAAEAAPQVTAPQVATYEAPAGEDLAADAATTATTATTGATGATAPAAADQPADEDQPSDEPIPDAEALLTAVRPGWIYRDSLDHWYLGVGDEHGRELPLLRLPEFTLVDAADPSYPLAVAGAGEIAVVPLHANADETESSVR